MRLSGYKKKNFMENQEKQTKLRSIGQVISFLIIGWILIFGILKKIDLDWKGFVFLSALEVILVIPWISEINFFDLFKIKTGIDKIGDKLQSIETKLEVQSTSKAQNITYNVNVPNPEQLIRQQKESETGVSPSENK